VTYRELTRKLSRLGCKRHQRIRGEREIWINLANRRKTTIWAWGSRYLPIGTLVRILDDLGIEQDDFEAT
jgi:hypothetical protein